MPFWVAANRDELRARPALPPSVWDDGHFLSPTDVQGGGSWLGLTRTGLFVGVTNRFPSERFPERESRGQLVVEALRHSSAAALRDHLDRLPAKRFNSFHLLYVDRTDAFVTWSDGEAIRHDVLGDGVHVVTERSLGGDDRGRTTLIESLLPTLERDERGLPTSAALQRLLGTADPQEPARGVCVDLPEFGYGSRSSLVCFVGEPVARTRWWWAEGRPDQTPFVEHPEWIEALAR